METSAAVASEQTVEPMGSAGAVSPSRVDAAGFATLPDNAFGTGATVPMVPQTWRT